MSQGNTVVVEWTFTGTHKGEVLGIPATNKKVEIPGVWILVLEAGKVNLLKVRARTILNILKTKHDTAHALSINL